MNATDCLPDALRAKIEAHRPQLERSGGSIQLAGGVWRLRVWADHPERGCVHRSIRLGDDATATAARAMIDGWRQEYAAAQAEANRLAEEERAHARLVKQYRRAVLARATGPRHRRRLARELGDPGALLAFILCGASECPPPRPGRRPAGGLC